MIITRTPFRISFVGGGSDLPNYYSRGFGQVLSTSINKYIYVVAKKQIGIVEFKYRISWSKIEFCNDINEIEHPIVRAALKKHNIDFPIAINTFSDIPANTGLGSSSAFTVGLLQALYAIRHILRSPEELAEEAAEIEIDILKRVMGKQDHYSSALGGINTFKFNADGSVLSNPVLLSDDTEKRLENNLILFYTQQKRDASAVLTTQDKATDQNYSRMTQMRDLVTPLRNVLEAGHNLDEFGQILDKAWQLKRSLTNDISSFEIDDYYQRGIKAGAIGGKILGAGGGGFLLFYVPQNKQGAVITSLKDLFNIKIKLDKSGACVRYHDPI